MTAPDRPERTISVPGGFLVMCRSVTGGMAIHEYGHVEEPGDGDPSEHSGSVYVPGTAEVLSAVITELTALLTDVRRAERDETVAEWLDPDPDPKARATAFLARAKADPDVDTGGTGTSPTFLASVIR